MSRDYKAAVLGALSASASVLMLMSAAAPAGPERVHSSIQLLGAVAAVPGLQIKTDADECGLIQGSYSSSEKQMMICTGEQSNPTQWSEEVQDTLRHEAIHLVQDCADGQAFDDRFANLLNDRELDKQLRHAEVDRDAIEDGYRLLGADDEAIHHELEAWSMAPDYSNEEVAALVIEACL